ncbi:MAG: pyridoxamine 5'-phosphate oxidase family protein [Campylobacterota bacterium]|nr:pyridoxamine 5'-phosphate oxidase family protein [Campylobacterota bacterium]
MDKNLKRIDSFLEKHHVMSLATSDEESLHVCNLFYVFDIQNHSFIVASGDETTHVRHILKNPDVAGSVVLETKTVGKIQGVQFNAAATSLKSSALKKLYFKTFPYALAMNPKLWQIKVNYFKLTDNRLGFGKKIIWRDTSV